MGSVCSCCDDNDDEEHLQRPRGHTPARTGVRVQPMNTAVSQVQPEKTRCDICSRVVDPCLLDGHRESCRAQHRKKMQEQQSSKRSPTIAPAPPPHNQEDIPVELLCIVCMEAKKEYAFVPCGHVVGCSDCVRVMDACPVCRTARRGLLKVDMDDTKACQCKHCGHVITPAYFDGHREVCALQQRQLREEGLADAVTPSDTHTHKGPSDELRKCVNCKSADRDTALLPCGHRVLCRQCASLTATCPMCLSTVVSLVTMYDT